MNKILATCLLSLSISSAALATEEIQGSTDWLSQNTAPQTTDMIMKVRASTATIKGLETNVEVPKGNDIQEALSLGMQMLDAINLGKMRLALGMLLMIFIWGLKAFWETLPSNAIPWVTAGIATMGAAAVGMISGWPWERILTDALTVSTSAGGLWSLIGKYVSNLGKKQ